MSPKTSRRVRLVGCYFLSERQTTIGISPSHFESNEDGD